ncbi:DinB family protein [Aquimarina aggregata]|uniref:DinB family protein n=1 Tax=Aquimarina aggregata TaxID=1642818 RepID=UPI00248FDAB9|nr:DinB family protein [Aquimarina aggregata]
MTEIEMLSKQTHDTYQWIYNLINSIPEEKWNETPEVLESNVTWQVGHLIISIYYHSILVVKGHQKDVLKLVPIKKYSDLYTFYSSPRNSTGKFSLRELKNHLDIIVKKSIEIINSLAPEELKNELVPGKVEHPVAKTKFEAIDWNIKHTMWHCGQLASLKRILGNPYQFEIKKVEKM